MNVLQFAPNRKKTNAEVLKARVLEIARTLLDAFEEDENKENLAFIVEAKAKFDEFEKHQPAIYLYVEGGVLQGASATCEMDFNLFDKDNYDQTEPEETEQTPEKWDKMIKKLTRTKEIKGVF